MRIALALALLAAADGPSRLSYWFELWGVPVGVVVLERGAGELTYRSRLVFTRGEDRTRLERSATLKVDGDGRLATGAFPESLWLARRPGAVGCARVVEELGGRAGDACVLRRDGEADEGTVLGAAYRARYGGDGVMQGAVLGDSRFLRIEGPAHALAPPDLFGGGLPVRPGPANGALRLEPPVDLPRPRARQRAPPGLDRGAGARARRRRARPVRGEAADGGGLRRAVHRGGELPRPRASVPGEGEGARADGAARPGVAGGAGRGARVPARVGAREGVGRCAARSRSDQPGRGAPVPHLPLAAGVAPGDAGALWLQVLRGDRRVERAPVSSPK